MKRNILIAISAAMLSVACQTKIDFEDAGISSRLIVNSLIYVDSTIQCTVLKTYIVTSNTNAIYPIKKATVLLYENGALIDTMQHTAAGKYISKITAQYGKIYTIEATANSYPKATGKSEALLPCGNVHIDSIGKIVSSNFSDDNLWLYRLRFDKNNAETGYYRMTIECLTNSDVYDPQTGALVDSGSVVLPGRIDEELSRGVEFYRYKRFPKSATYIYFTDKLKNEHNQGYVEVAVDFGVPSHHKAIFNIEKISADLFLYYHSINTAEEGDDLMFFSQPVQIFSNIEGGVGIVGVSKVLPTYTFPQDN